MDRFRYENLCADLASKVQNEYNNRRRDLRNNFHGPSQVDHLTCIHRVLYRPHKRRQDVPTTAVSSNEYPKPFRVSHAKDLIGQVENPIIVNTRQKSKSISKNIQSDSARTILKLKPVRERKFAKARLAQEQQKQEPQLHRLKVQREKLDLPVEKETRSKKPKQNGKDSRLKPEPTSTTKDVKHLENFRHLQRKDFDLVNISGAHQNCLYRCIALSLDNALLQKHLKSTQGTVQDLDRAAENLRDRVYIFGNQCFTQITNVVLNDSHNVIYQERKCENFKQVLEQIKDGNVPADSFDKILLVNLLEINLIIYQFDYTEKTFRHFLDFEPHDIFSKNESNKRQTVFLQYCSGNIIANEPGNHFDLLIKKQS